MVSNIGSWMYSAAAGWLMTSLNSDALIVSLVQVANSLPLFLLALPAGAFADLFDRRRLILALEILTTLVSAVFALLVSLHAANPTILLLFALAVAMLGALEMPAWQSIVPDLVPKGILPSAIATNSLGVNLSRAIGPALGGAAILALGIAVPFWFDAFSNLGVILIFILWRASRRVERTLPTERLPSAVRAGLQYARNSRPLRAALVRAGGFFLFASAYWAVLPLLAKEQLHGGPTLYGLLLGFIGVAAIMGALILPQLVARLGSNTTVTLGGAVTAAALAIFALATSALWAFIACALAGVSWIAVVATLNVSAQRSLPDWVRGRGLAIYTAAFFGSMTLGSLLWGYLAERVGLRAALLAAAAGALLAAVALSRAKLLSGAVPDLSPSMHWPPPILSGRAPHDPGRVMVTVEYRLRPEHRPEFLQALPSMAHGRRRDGAFDWGIYQDSTQPDRLVEVFFLESWIEHLRQHQRVTVADRHLQEQLELLLSAPPTVTHYVEPQQ